MGLPLCPGGWCPVRVCTSGPQKPFLHTWLVAVYLFPISLCPRGVLTRWVSSCPLWYKLSLLLGWRKVSMGNAGWVYRQVGLMRRKKS